MLFITWLYRQFFHCCRRIDTFLFSPEKVVDNFVPVSTLPWLWVGSKHENGSVFDHTNQVNENVEFGMRVTTEWLDEVFNTKNVTWLYLDPKTLEETEFPSDGFVIDDPEPTDSEKSGDSADPFNDHTE
jgi:hypothetical protein